MKRLLLVLFFFVSPLYAEEFETPSPFSYEITPEIFQYQYRETTHGQFFMEDKGTFGAVNFDGRYYFDQHHVGFSTRFALGSVDYRSATAGTMNDDPYHYIDSRLTHGYHFMATPCFEITPYWGLGYRYLVNDASGRLTSTGRHIGYYRSSKYIYIPFGTELLYLLDCQSRVKLNLEYDFLFVGFQRSELLSATITNRQYNGHGFRISMAYEYDFDCFYMGLKPFFRYWCVEDSDAVYNPWNGKYYHEPHNVTKEIGVGVSFRF